MAIRERCPWASYFKKNDDILSALTWSIEKGHQLNPIADETGNGLSHIEDLEKLGRALSVYALKSNNAQSENEVIQRISPLTSSTPGRHHVRFAREPQTLSSASLAVSSDRLYPLVDGYMGSSVSSRGKRTTGE